MYRPITVAKEKQKKRAPFLSLFIRIVSSSTWSRSAWPILKQQRTLMGPASDSGGLIDYRLGYRIK